MNYFWPCAFTLFSLALASGQLIREKLRAKFNATNFVFDLKGKKSDSQGKGGSIRLLTETQMPPLKNEGVSLTLLSVDPCAINLHNIHQFASEIIYVIDAEKLQCGFVEENGGRLLLNNLSTGMTTFFPKGLIHYQMNLGCKTAKYLSMFNSEDPGIQTIFLQTFKFPNEALSAAFNLNVSKIESLRDKMPANIAEGQKECKMRCEKLKKSINI